MQIADVLDIKVQFVPYKGGKPAALAGLQGEVMIAAGGVPEHIELLRAGKMRNLFQCGTEDIKLDNGQVLRSIGGLVPATKSLLPVGSTYNLMLRRSVPVEADRAEGAGLRARRRSLLPHRRQRAAPISGRSFYRGAPCHSRRS